MASTAPRRGSSESGAAEPAPDAVPDWLLRVRNEGAATANRCRATLLRLDLEEGGQWRRIEPNPAAVPLCWSDGATERDLAPGEAAEIVVARGNGLPPGQYRFGIAVINGEERRVAFELAVAEPTHW